MKRGQCCVELMVFSALWYGPNGCLPHGCRVFPSGELSFFSRLCDSVGPKPPAEKIVRWMPSL